MAKDDSVRWNEIYRNGSAGRPAPAAVLEQYRYLLPAAGRAVDLACGRGGNALLLAAADLETHAWDISREALDRLTESAAALQLGIQTRLCDLSRERPGGSSFDVIVASRFLDRSLIPYLSPALKQNGLLFYQTFITDKINDSGPCNPDYLLKPNELLHMFSDLRILLYREEGLTGDTEQGLRNEAMLIGQKR